MSEESSVDNKYAHRSRPRLALLVDDFYFESIKAMRAEVQTIKYMHIPWTAPQPYRTQTITVSDQLAKCSILAFLPCRRAKQDL